MINAVVFVLTQHLLPDAERCISYCLNRGYNMIGLVKDDWKAAMALAVEGTAPVIVAASPDRVDPDREPRVEFVSHARNAGPAGHAHGERTHILKRNAGA